jgi:hypothetical protein
MSHRPPRRRDRQRGNSLLLALIVMSALATLGSLTVVSVQSGLKTSTNDRSQAIAMFAAESGVAITMDMLRQNFDVTTGWTAFVKTSNVNVVALGAPQLPSSGALPSDPINNPFDLDQRAWYSVEIYNNRDDPGFAFVAPATVDQDGRVIIRATGHGPGGSLAIIEVDVQRVGLPAMPPPAAPQPAWGQPLPPGMVILDWHIVL